MLPPPARSPRGPALDRRRLLGLLAVAAGSALVGGCNVSDPTIQSPSSVPTGSASASASPRPTASPRPSPTPVDVSAYREAALAAYAQAILNGPHRKDLSARRRALLTFVRDAHTAHAGALSSNPPDVAADVGKLSLDRSLRKLRDQERSAAALHRRRALTASGSAALTLASMAQASTAYAAVVISAEPPRVGRIRKPQEMAKLSDVAANQELVRQFDAVIYGYQVAIGRLSVGSKTHDRAVGELEDVRIRRDIVVGWLTRRAADVPAAEPAYVPSVDVHDPASAGKLIRSMHISLQPFCGLLIAAAGSTAERKQAMTFLADAVSTGRRWGAPISAWPGRVA